MPPKRKSDPKQHSLEEVVEKPAVKKRSKKGELTKPEVKEADDSHEDLVKRKLARKHQDDPAYKAPEAEKSPKKGKEAKGASSSEPKAPSDEPVVINRAPTLTLWVAAVAQRQGYSRDSGLTFGKAIAGILAQAKGRSIGVYEQKEGDPEAKKEQQEKDEKEGVERIEVFGMTLKAVKEGGDYRATEANSQKAMEPAKVQKYLEGAFKDRLSDAESAFKELAESFTKDQIGNEAYSLYEQFRPSVAQGKQGWGKKGELELTRVKELKSGM